MNFQKEKDNLQDFVPNEVKTHEVYSNCLLFRTKIHLYKQKDISIVS